MNHIRLYNQIVNLAADLQKKVADYIEFLTFKASRNSAINERITGLAKGLISMKDNFDDPLDDFQAYM